MVNEIHTTHEMKNQDFCVLEFDVCVPKNSNHVTYKTFVPTTIVYLVLI